MKKPTQDPSAFSRNDTASGSSDDQLFATIRTLASEIVDSERNAEHLDYVPESLMSLYDAADPLFTAPNILRILDALEQYRLAARPFDRDEFNRNYQQRFFDAYMLGREDERKGLPRPDKLPAKKTRH